MHVLAFSYHCLSLLVSNLCKYNNYDTLIFFFVELNKLVKKVDRRYSNGSKHGTFQSKPRAQSSPSLVPVPTSFPRWAVKAACYPPPSSIPSPIPSPKPSNSETSYSESSSSDESDGVFMALFELLHLRLGVLSVTGMWDGTLESCDDLDLLCLFQDQRSYSSPLTWS